MNLHEIKAFFTHYFHGKLSDSDSEQAETQHGLDTAPAITWIQKYIASSSLNAGILAGWTVCQKTS